MNDKWNPRLWLRNWINLPTTEEAAQNAQLSALIADVRAEQSALLTRPSAIDVMEACALERQPSAL
ncbi:TPA: hypothetical protein ACKQAW_000380 [Stenotrophomonas maltophilia]